MALLRSLPENATLADLRRTYADLLEKLHPYRQRLMRGPSPLTPVSASSSPPSYPASIAAGTVRARIPWSHAPSASTRQCSPPRWTTPTLPRSMRT
jgi:hypothetical protein